MDVSLRILRVCVRKGTVTPVTVLDPLVLLPTYVCLIVGMSTGTISVVAVVVSVVFEGKPV